MAEKSILDQIVKQRRKSRVSERAQDDLIRQFVAGATARTAADLVDVNRHTATLYFHKWRKLISLKLVMMMWTASPQRHLVPKCGRRSGTERETVHERVYAHRAGFG